jgi:hypothetical protein
MGSTLALFLEEETLASEKRYRYRTLPTNLVPFYVENYTEDYEITHNFSRCFGSGSRQVRMIPYTE